MNSNIINLVKKNYTLFIIFLLVIALIIVVCFCCIDSLPGIKSEGPPEGEPKASQTKAQEYGAGDVGESEGSLLPPAIFDTYAIIIEIKSSYLTAWGDGSNFADKQARTLNLIFTEKTKTFEPGQKVYYLGIEGLKYLNPGTRILVSGAENIRGKTEFKVGTINISSK